jgi:hypothetical protein
LGKLSTTLDNILLDNLPDGSKSTWLVNIDLQLVPAPMGFKIVEKVREIAQ